MTNRDKVLDVLRGSLQPLDDDEIARRAGFTQRQTANQICRALAAEGVITRYQTSGKIVNRLVPREPSAQPPAASSPAPSPIPASQAVPLEEDEPAGSAREQRAAEGYLLEALSARLGVRLAPRRVVHPSGARVELDGADTELTVLVECWAHQGPAKVAHKYKLVNDAVKLSWIAGALTPRPKRLILCVSDAAAIRHLQGSSWQGAAIQELGVEVEVVELPPEVRSAVLSAQGRQFR